MNKILTKTSSFFKFKERGATFKKEIIGGLSTFLAMGYILAVNPGMLSHAHGAGDYTGVFFLGTAFSAMIGTLAMGLKANVPIALAPGMGVNAFFTYTVAGTILNMDVQEALLATFFSGLLYAIIALTPARKYIAKLLPKNMKLGIGAMIGLFLAYIGLVDSGIIVSGANPMGNAMHFGDDGRPTGWKKPLSAFQPGAASIGTATKLGNFADPFVIVALVTIALVFILHFMKVKGAAIIAILTGVLMLAILKFSGVGDADQAFKLQDYKSFGKFGDLSKGMWSSITHAFTKGTFYIAIFVFLYIDFFDTTGTLFSIGQQAGLNKDKKEAEKWLKNANLVDAGSTILGSVLLTSTTTSFIESSVGVSQGARTGFSSVVIALLFGLSIAMWPILTPILPIAHTQDKVFAQSGTIMPVTGPILVLVGSLMVSQLKFFEWDQIIDIPVLFVTLIFGMLGFSISTGIAAGVIIYYLINLIALIVTHFKPKFHVMDESIQMTITDKEIRDKRPDYKARVINPVMIILFLLAIAYFGTMPLYYG